MRRGVFRTVSSDVGDGALTHAVLNDECLGGLEIGEGSEHEIPRPEADEEGSPRYHRFSLEYSRALVCAVSGAPGGV
ncbi:MAG: hypothetical protein HC933_13720 [Pleurocapsa sp. SU_196_0]|nr:hypothetical protein [Pleurocapsa sp. SU_196_0]